MSKIPNMLTLEINVGADSDADEIDHAARQLRNELLELDVDSVEPASADDVPAGAKGVDAAAFGALIVQWAGSSGLHALATVLADWLNRDKSRSIELQMGEDVIVVSGISAADQSRLIEQWIMRHGEQ